MKHLLMLHRGVGDALEAEPAVIELDGALLSLELDDGDRLVVDFDELLAVVLGEPLVSSWEAA